MRRALLIFCLLLGGSVHAVIVSGGDGAGNDTATGAGSGWDYVGTVGGASGVYLGDYGGSSWVLTASHVGAGSFTLNGVTYSAVVDSLVSLTNSDGSPADLVLFRIDGNPGLTTLALASETPSRNASVTMIGYGIGREASETIGINGTAYTGYLWSEPHEKRWGANRVQGTTTVTYTNSTVTTAAFYTSFQSTGSRAQATSGDSGGGVFTSSGALAGIMIAVGQLSGQPENASVYGEETFVADIATYRSQILEIVSAAPVPEPPVGILFGGAAVALLLIRRRSA